MPEDKVKKYSCLLAEQVNGTSFEASVNILSHHSLHTTDNSMDETPLGEWKIFNPPVIMHGIALDNYPNDSGDHFKNLLHSEVSHRLFVCCFLGIVVFRLNCFSWGALFQITKQLYHCHSHISLTAHSFSLIHTEADPLPFPIHGFDPEQHHTPHASHCD